MRDMDAGEGPLLGAAWSGGIVDVKWEGRCTARRGRIMMHCRERVKFDVLFLCCKAVNACGKKRSRSCKKKFQFASIASLSYLDGR